MNKNSNTYTIIYAAVMVVVVAILLALAATALKKPQQDNIRSEKMGAILKSIGQAKDMETASNKNAYIAEEFGKYIQKAYFVDAEGNSSETEVSQAVNSLGNLPQIFADKKTMPVFEAEINGEKAFVVPVSGNGLWGKIWGYVALKPDFNTIIGVVFDHASETPGLGAEIATNGFQKQFQDKKITKDGEISFALLKGKGSSNGNDNAVDAITGGTMTSAGVTKMLNSCLGDYQAYFNKTKAENN